MKKETPHAIFMVSKNKNKFWVAVFFAITTNCKKKRKSKRKYFVEERKLNRKKNRKFFEREYVRKNEGKDRKFLKERM
jgi:hypothetical protein